MLGRRLYMLLLGVVVGVVGAAEELRITTDTDVDLFQQNRAVRRLPAGIVVPTVPHPRDAEWLRVQLDGKVYEARAEHFASVEELTLAFRQEDATVKPELDQAAQQIARLRDRVVHLNEALLYLQRDKITTYRESVGGDGGEDAVRQRYEDVLLPNRARDLEREWLAELEKLGRESEALWQKRSDIRTRAAKREAVIAARLERFRAATEEKRVGIYPDPYVAVAKSAPLFTGQKQVGSLPYGTVVPGLPDPKYPDWLRVRYRGRTYGVRREFMLSHIRLEHDYRVKLADLGEKKVRLEAQRDLYRELLDMQSKATEKLKYRAIDSGYGTWSPFEVPDGLKDVYRPQYRERTEIFVQADRAEELIEDWKARIKALDKAWQDAMTGAVAAQAEWQKMDAQREFLAAAFSKTSGTAE